MAKITLPTIASGFASTTALNTAFDSIEAEFQNKVLYRDNTSGEGNQMENDLDMNNNNLLNVGAINGVDASLVTDLDGAVSSAQAAQAAAEVAQAAAESSETNAAASESNAAVSEANAAASAANLPNASTAGADKYIKSNATADGWEYKTAGEVLTDIGAEPADATILKDADIGVSVQAYDATIVVDADIGVSIQAYDVDTAKTDVAQTWSNYQRTQETADNDLSHDLNNANPDFTSTPTAGGALTFTNIPATPTVAKGTILFSNTSNYAITAHANTKISTTDLATISATGTYMLAYRSSNGNVYVWITGNFDA